MKFPHHFQIITKDCGPTCLKIVSEYYGKNYSLDYLREKTNLTREGVSLLGISDAAEAIGFRTFSVKLPLKEVLNVPLPCIAHWQQKHFIVVYKITNKKVFVSDPSFGLLSYTHNEFVKYWCQYKNTELNDSLNTGIVLLLEPTPQFYSKDDIFENKKAGFRHLITYLSQYKKLIIQLVLGLFVSSVVGLILPFLTQALVDVGINQNNKQFIYLILCAQLVLFISQSSVEFVRSWLILHIGARVNISVISDFLVKLMKLPIPFFDNKMVGDLLQSVIDHDRIQQFLTASTLSIIFSFITLIAFSSVLFIYNVKIFFLFIIGSSFSIFWMTFFIKKRRVLDYKRFQELSANQNTLVQIINGMQEIKLNGSEKEKRWEWEKIQSRLFNINVSSLKISQYQQAGSLFFNQIKNIFITFLAANEVINGSITLGMMLAISFILGQLNAPLEQMLSFFQIVQDTKISLDRVSEIHSKKNEENDNENKIRSLCINKRIKISSISFRYGSKHTEYVLKNIDFEIPNGEITSIVGTSGSGKTTLMKLLLKFYQPIEGDIFIGEHNLKNISASYWRSKCGVVMQDGYIFADTIMNNIAMRNDTDLMKIKQATDIANIGDFIDTLPLGYQTKIGMNGHGLSAGQKQRILIARAVYKNPEIIFLDEATSDLDTENENIIMRNLNLFFERRTVVIIAHRLSTVKKASQIIVLDKGKITEIGKHQELINSRKSYYNLIKNQLEL